MLVRGAHTDDTRQAFHLLYQQKWTDRKIAAALAVSKPTIANWRNQANLPPNGQQCRRKLDPAKAEDLYRQGMSCTQIAKVLGVGQTIVLRWRNKAGLPLNFERPPRVSLSKRRAAGALLRGGATVQQVHAEVGVSRTFVERLRRRLAARGIALPKSKPGPRPRAPDHELIMRKIRHAIGRCQSEDVAADAAHDLYVAVTDGRVSMGHIARRAPDFIRRAADLNGYGWGRYSLDDELGEGLSFVEALEDASALEAFDAIFEIGED